MDGLLFSVHTIFSSVCLCTHADFFGHCFTFHSFLSHTMSTKHIVKNDPLKNIVRALSEFYIVIPVGGDK